MNHARVPRQPWSSLVLLLSLAFFAVVVSCSDSEDSPAPSPIASTGTPGSEEAVGERPFLETRFAQAFKVVLDNGGDINNPNVGDSVVLSRHWEHQSTQGRSKASP